MCAYFHKHHQIKLHHNTVYYLKQDKNGGTVLRHLRIYSKPYRRKYGNIWAKGKVSDRVDIENRLAIIDEKSRIGDWEADTIVSKLKNFKAKDTTRASIRALKVHKTIVHTITMDNSKGFYRHAQITKALDTETYFCRSYHS